MQATSQLNYNNNLNITASQGDAKKRSEFSVLVLSKNWKKNLITKSEQRIKRQPMPLVFDKVVKQCGSYTKGSGQYLARRVHAILHNVSFDEEKMIFDEANFMKFNRDPYFNDEHFIINQSYGISFKYGSKTIEYKYPDRICPYVSHLGNYIFILEEVNSSLGNSTIKEKIIKIEEFKNGKEKNIFKDKLSELKYEAAKKAFSKGNCPTHDELAQCASKDDALQLLDNYFQEGFMEEYVNYSKELKNKFDLLTINDL